MVSEVLRLLSVILHHTDGKLTLGDLPTSCNIARGTSASDGCTICPSICRESLCDINVCSDRISQALLCKSSTRFVMVGSYDRKLQTPARRLRRASVTGGNTGEAPGGSDRDQMFSSGLISKAGLVTDVKGVLVLCCGTVPCSERPSTIYFRMQKATNDSQVLE